jgi:hypothetical protein
VIDRTILTDYLVDDKGSSIIEGFRQLLGDYVQLVAELEH